MTVKKEKQWTRVDKLDESKLYYFDMKILVATLLFFTWTIVFHIDMTEIVDMLSKFWHFNW
jgi:hypothetical protein